MKNALKICFLVLIFSICFMPYGGAPVFSAAYAEASANSGAHLSGQSCQADNGCALQKVAAPVTDYYIQQSDGNSGYFRSFKPEKTRTFENNAQSTAFSDAQKKLDAVFYPPYLCACSVRCISLSKFKKLTIYRQTVL